MSCLPSVAADAVLLDVFRAYPGPARPLLDYHQALLRGPSPFAVAEREMIAAHVSGLNACGYCHGVHRATAEAFGVAAGWDEHALHDAASICGLFNLMSRIVDGLGVQAGDEYFALSSRRLADIGYVGLKDLLP